MFLSHEGRKGRAARVPRVPRVARVGRVGHMGVPRGGRTGLTQLRGTARRRAVRRRTARACRRFLFCRVRLNDLGIALIFLLRLLSRRLLSRRICQSLLAADVDR